MQMLTDLFSRFGGKAEELVTAEERAQHDERVKAKAEQLAAAEQRASDLARLAELGRLGDVAGWRQAVREDAEAIAAIAVQIVPHLRHLEDVFRSMTHLHLEAATLAEDLGVHNPTTTPQFSLAWGSVSRAVARAFVAAGAGELATHLDKWLMPNAGEVIQAERGEFVE